MLQEKLVPFQYYVAVLQVQEPYLNDFFARIWTWQDEVGHDIPVFSSRDNYSFPLHCFYKQI